jgi:hypothetical protein
MKKNYLIAVAISLSSLNLFSQGCTSPIAEFFPNATAYNTSDYSMEEAAQVFTAGISASNFTVSLDLATCKANGLCDAQLDIVTVAGGEPQWTNVIGSDVAPESEIYGWIGCVPGIFGTVVFEFDNVNLTSGMQYALVLKPATGGDPGASLAWRRSSIPDDPSDPYSGGSSWINNLSMETSDEYTDLDMQFSICSDCTNPVAVYNPNASDYFTSDYEYENASQVFTALVSASTFNVSLELATCKLNGLCGAQLDVVTVVGGEPQWTNVIGSASIPESEVYGWVGCVSGLFGMAVFEFNNVNLVVGTQYALVLKPSPGGDAAATLAWRRSATPVDPSNPYSGGNSWINNLDMETTNEYTDLDMQFDICGFGTNNLVEEILSAEEIVIFPNPFNHAFTLEVSPTSDFVEVSIVDLSGKLLNSNLFFNTEIINIPFDGPAGTYFVTIKTNENVKVLKLVKE